MLSPVSGRVADSLQAGKPSRYVTSHPGQLSLAIPPWIGAVSTTTAGEENSRLKVLADMGHILV